MNVSAVVVYYDTPERIGSTLSALRAQDEALANILVVDNSSVELELASPAQSDHDLRWETSPTNSGYGAACNRGAALTRSEYILFLNADLTLEPDAVRLLRHRLTADARAAIAGPRLFGLDGRVELSARSFPTVSTGLIGRMSMVTRLLRRISWVPPALRAANRDEDVVVDWVSGACMLVRRAAFEAVCGFDEQYWMYWEDADLCRRLSNAGWRVWFEPKAVGCHSTGSSGRSERTIRAFHLSAARYYSMHAATGPLVGSIARRLLVARAELLVRWQGR